MTAVEEHVSNQLLQRQIIELTGRVNQIACGIDDIKDMLKHMEERIRRLENNEASTHPLMESKIDAAWRKIDDHEKRLETLTQVVNKLDQSNRLMAWLGGILGSTVAIWLITQVLGLIK